MLDRSYPPLADARFRLEPLTPGHADAMFAAVERDRAHLRRWLSWVDVTTTRAAVDASIATFRERAAAGTDRVYLLMADERVIGGIGVHGIDTANRHAEIGYWLAEDQQGRGVMTSACRAVTAYGFRELQMHRLEIRCAVENRRSRAIPERLGYAHEATIAGFLFLGGRFHDVAVYALLNPD